MTGEMSPPSLPRWGLQLPWAGKPMLGRRLRDTCLAPPAPPRELSSSGVTLLTGARQVSPTRGHGSRVCLPCDSSPFSQRDTGRPHLRVWHVCRDKMHSQPLQKQDDQGQPGAQRARVLRAESRPSPCEPRGRSSCSRASEHLAGQQAMPTATHAYALPPKTPPRPLAFLTLSPFTAFSFLSPPADIHQSPCRARQGAPCALSWPRQVWGQRASKGSGVLDAFFPFRRVRTMGPERKGFACAHSPRTVSPRGPPSEVQNP